MPKKIKHLTFGLDFNQKVKLPKNLTQLTFGNKFNQKYNWLKNELIYFFLVIVLIKKLKYHKKLSIVIKKIS